MSFLPHTITGAVVGSLFQNPGMSFLSGAVSHLVLDFIPHFDPDLKPGRKKTKQEKLFVTSVIILDFSLSCLVLVLLLPFPNLFLGGLGGMLPDVDNFLQHKFKAFPLLSRIGIPVHDLKGSWMHHQLKFDQKINFLLGIVMQSTICLCGIAYIYLHIG